MASKCCTGEMRNYDGDGMDLKTAGKERDKTTFALRILLMTLVAALLVSACGYSESTPTETSETNHSPMKAPTPTATPEPSGTPTPIPLELPKPPDKSQATASPAERTREGARSEGKGPGQGVVYTWEDGDRILRVVLQNDLVVQETAANTPEDVVVAKGAKDNIIQKRSTHRQDDRPVFRSESGGGLMTLPGGVLLALDPEWDQTMVESFFSRNDISTDLTSELDFLVNGFLVETEPGFPSLDLANALAAQDGVVISSPNWWREVEAK